MNGRICIIALLLTLVLLTAPISANTVSITGQMNVIASTTTSTSTTTSSTSTSTTTTIAPLSGITINSIPMMPASEAVGSIITLIASWTGGLPPYQIIYNIYNSTTNVLLSSTTFTGVATNSYTYQWMVPKALAGNAISVNAVVIDSQVATNTLSSTMISYINLLQNIAFDLSIVFVLAALFFLLIALFRFPYGSIQNIIMYLMSGLCMYLVFSFYTIAISVGVNAKVNVMIWDFMIIYVTVMVTFPTIGFVLAKMTGRKT